MTEELVFVTSYFKVVRIHLRVIHGPFKVIKVHKGNLNEEKPNHRYDLTNTNICILYNFLAIRTQVSHRGFV